MSLFLSSSISLALAETHRKKEGYTFGLVIIMMDSCFYCQILEWLYECIHNSYSDYKISS